MLKRGNLSQISTYAKRTVVINLYGGPGTGKTATASGLFYRLKLAGVSCALLDEFAKAWAWEGREPTVFDQALVFGSQWHDEARLFGKVDVIVTDSPVLLCAFYEWFRYGINATLPAVLGHLGVAEQLGVRWLNYWMGAVPNFEAEGRHESESVALQAHETMKGWLSDSCGVHPKEISELGEKRVNRIFDEVQQFLKSHADAGPLTHLSES